MRLSIRCAPNRRIAPREPSTVFAESSAGDADVPTGAAGLSRYASARRAEREAARLDDP